MAQSTSGLPVWNFVARAHNILPTHVLDVVPRPTYPMSTRHRSFLFSILAIAFFILSTLVYTVVLKSQLSSQSTLKPQHQHQLHRLSSKPLQLSSPTFIHNLLQTHPLSHIPQPPASSPQKPSSPKLSMTSLQHVRHSLRRLSYYEGPGHGPTRAVNVVVSLLGVFGMFAAVMGALLAPWLVDAGNSAMDFDRFVYWVRSNGDDDDDDERQVLGQHREQKYSMLRMFDVS